MPGHLTSKLLHESSVMMSSFGSPLNTLPIASGFKWVQKTTGQACYGGHVCCSASLQSYNEEGTSKMSENRRVNPKNPRLNVQKTTLKEFTKNLEDKLQAYAEVSKPTLLFSADERSALNRTKPDLDTLHSEKWPLLHTLSISGDSFGVDRLLKQNVDVNILDKDGYSALQRAVLARKESIVNHLIRAQADTSIRDKGGATLLHLSIQTGSMTLVRSFLHCGIGVNAADNHGWTPLHLAVLTGRADIVRLLLISGADKTLTNEDGLTPFDLCLSLGRAFNSFEVAKSLKRFPKVTQEISQNIT